MHPKPRYISPYLDLVWEDDQPRIYVAGKRFLACSFLVTNTKVTEEMIASRSAGPPGEENKTIEDLLEEPGSRSLEGIDAVDEGLLSADEVMFGFASSLEGFVKFGYSSYTIGANLAFPLLKELARAGDPKAKRVLNWEIESRLKTGAINTAVVIVDTCHDVMTTEAWLIIMAMLEDMKISPPRAIPSLEMLAEKLAEEFPSLPDRVIEALIQTKNEAALKILFGRIGFWSSKDIYRTKAVKWGRRLIETLGVLPQSFVTDGHADLQEVVAEFVVSPGFTARGYWYCRPGLQRLLLSKYEMMPLLATYLQNTRLLEAMLDIVIKNPRPDVLAHLAGNPRSTTEMLTRIVKLAEEKTGNERHLIYKHLAGNPNARGINMNHDPRALRTTTAFHFTVGTMPSQYPFVLQYDTLIIPFDRLYFKQNPATIFNVKKSPTGLYHGKITLVTMETTQVTFDAWAKKNGFSRCLASEHDEYARPAYYNSNHVYIIDSLAGDNYTFKEDKWVKA